MWQSTKDLKITEYVSYGIHAIKNKGGTNQKNILKILAYSYLFLTKQHDKTNKNYLMNLNCCNHYPYYLLSSNSK
jgi:hypothetical protein